MLLAGVLAWGLVPQPAMEQAEAAAANGTLTITHQPVGGTFAKGNPVYLYAQAFSSANNLLGYQWYRNTSNTNSGGTAIDGATSANLVDQSAKTLAAGTYYYYVVATDKKTGQAVPSKTAAVKIVDKGSIGNALQNGDFETKQRLSGSSGAMYSAPPWDTTHNGTTISGYMGKGLEIGTPDSSGLAYGIPSDGVAHGQSVVELAAAAASSVFQEIATTPGSVYEWKLDHGGRYNTAAGYETPLNGFDVMAVVIGPGLDGVWSGSSATAGGASSTYPYGQNEKSYFHQIINKAAADNGVSVSGLKSGATYNTVYDGKNYYVRIIATQVKKWGHYSGTYTVPEGQGASVFSFVCLSTACGIDTAGNILDNIVFAQGSPIEASSDVDSQGNGLLTADSQAGYSYGILEVRGSTTTPVSGFKVTNAGGATLAEDATLSAAGCPGWYTPGAGKITFSNLTPGKTYRIVQVPTGAIGGVMGQNKTPANVLDENCYDDFAVKPVSSGSGSSVGNIQVTAISEGSTSTLIVDPARADVEYAVIAANESGPVNPDTPVKDWASSTTGRLTIPGLTPGTTYMVVGRPKGYDEITTGTASTSGTLIKTPPASFKDVAPADVERTSDNAGTITVKNAGTTTQKYMVYDAATKVAIGTGWYTVAAGASHSFAVDANATYQIVTCSEGAVPAPGVRSYPAPSENLAIDYVSETIPDRSAMPATLQYRAHDKDADTWRFGGADDSETPWLTGTGGARVALTKTLDDMATAGATGLTFTYRRTPEWTPAVGVDKTLEVPARPAAPVAGDGYTLDYTSADEAIKAGAKAIQVRKKGASNWTLVGAGATYGLALLGWTEKEPLELEVRTAAVEGTSFASVTTSATVPARAEGPAEVKGKKVKEADGTFSCSLTGVSDTMEYRAWGSGAAWTAVPAGATTVEGIADGTYEVRTKATADAPASFAVTASTTDAALVIDAAMSRFADQPWGYAPDEAAKTLQVKNSGTADAQVTDVSFTGANADSFQLMGTAQGTVAAGSTDTSRSIAPVAGLAPGSYRASAVVSYQEVDEGGAPTGTKYSAAVQLVLTVKKASQDPPRDMTSGATDTELSVSAKLPQGYTLADPMIEFSLDDGRTWQDGAQAASDATTFSTLFGGLSAATPYEVKVRMKADANRLESTQTASTFYTAYSAPEESALTIDFVAEKVTFASGLEAKSAADGAGDALTSGGKISSYLGEATTFSVRRASSDTSDGTIPASAWTGVAIPARPAAPASSSVSVTDADSSKATNGSITVAGATALQYRKTGEAAWISVNAESITGLGAGTYEVRTAATSTSFASMPVTATVQATAERYVTYMRNDGSTGDAATFVTQTLAASSGWKTTAPTPAPTREHYTFAGWHEAASFAEDGTPTLAAAEFDFTKAIAADTTLYALWTADTYTVSFNADGGAFAAGEAPGNQTVAYDGTATAPAHDPARTGYAFNKDADAGKSGWYLEGRAADKSEVFFDFSKSLAENFAAAGVTVPADAGEVKLLASWTANTFSVSFDTNNADNAGGAPTGAADVAYDGWITAAGEGGAHTRPAPDPVRAGYTFEAWHLVKADNTLASASYDFSKTLGENLVLAGIDTPAPGAALTVRAGWTELSYTVSFTTYEGDATAPSAQTLAYTGKLTDAAVQAAQNVTRPGFLLDTSAGSGWHLAGRAQGNTASFDFTKTLEENFTLAGMTPPAPPAELSITLVASWSENSYTVVYDEDASGDLTPGDTQVAGVSWTAPAASAPTDPTRAGYTFAGWHIPGRTTDALFVASETLETNYKNAGVAAPAAGAVVVLQPSFVANAYTLVFDADEDGAFDANAGDTQITGVVYSAGLLDEAAIAKPARQGYEFTGWTFAGSAAGTYDFTKTLEENASALSFNAPAAPDTGEATITLVPVFAAQSFIVGFDVDNNGSTEGEPSVSGLYYDFTPVSGNNPLGDARPADPTLPGFTFSHWALEGAPDTRAYDFALSLEDNCAAVPDKALDAVELPEAVVIERRVSLRPIFVPSLYTVAFDAAGGDTAPSPTNDVSFTGMLVSPEQEPKRPGYAFASWHVVTNAETGACAEVAFDFTKSLDANLVDAGFDFTGTDQTKPQIPAAGGTFTLAAKWNANTYHVLFDVNANATADTGETKIDSVFNATTLVAPDPAPKRPGYVFSSWRLAGRAEGNTATYDFAKSLEENLEAAGYDMTGTGTASGKPQVPRALSTIELVPEWTENTYRLVFDAAGGTPEPAAQEGVPYASAKPADVSAPTKDSVHEFTGWHIVTGQNAEGQDVLAEVAFDLAKTLEENFKAAGYDTTASGEGTEVPGPGAEVKLKAAWKVVAVSAVVPLSVGVAVDYDEAGQRTVLVPAPGDYAILSTTQAPLKVTSLACTPDTAGVASIFFGGTEGVALSVNGASVFDGGVGKTLSGAALPANKFTAAASPDGVVATKLLLDLAFTVPEGLAMGYLQGSLTDADTFVKLTYTVSIDEGGVS